MRISCIGRQKSIESTHMSEQENPIAAAGPTPSTSTPSSTAGAGGAMDQVIQLPQPTVAGRQESNATFLEWIIAVLVVVLAFLLGSAPARNSDLWLHLANGRQLAQGHAGLGVEPFTFPGANEYW